MDADNGRGIEDPVLPITDLPLDVHHLHRVQALVGDGAEVGEELQCGVHDHLVGGATVETCIPLRSGDWATLEEVGPAFGLLVQEHAAQGWAVLAEAAVDRAARVLLPHTGNCLANVGAVNLAGDVPLVGLEAALMAGVLQDLSCQHGIKGMGFPVTVPPEGWATIVGSRGEEGEGDDPDLAEAEEDLVQDGLAVDGVVERLADLNSATL